MVVVAGDVAHCPVEDRARQVGEAILIDSPLPSAFGAPSTWYADVAVPNVNDRGRVSDVEGQGGGDGGRGGVFRVRVAVCPDRSCHLRYNL